VTMKLTAKFRRCMEKKVKTEIEMNNKKERTCVLTH
jgi:hypothetical protein